MNITLMRLAHQLVENHTDFANAALIGIQPRGTLLSNRIASMVKQITGKAHIPYGVLDITFYRDDVGTGSLKLPSATSLNFSVTGMNVVLIDDVLHTGRTVRSAMDALLDFGRPQKVELLTLVDRRFSRELPVHPDYSGYAVDTILTQRVTVHWQERDGKDEVLLLEKDDVNRP